MNTQSADAAIDPTHPFAVHLRHVATRDEQETHVAWQPGDAPMPALYLSHGSPMTFEDGPWMRQLFDWARALPRPRAVLIVSAHWESRSLAMSSSGSAELVYDFGGFAPMYYRMRYDTPDAADLARTVQAVLPQDVHEHRERGLDHGAWVPLKVMYPQADVPVLQLSLPTDDPDKLLALGERLKVLREQGVLLVGSGFMTHGLQYLDRAAFTANVVPGWSRDFDEWAAQALAKGDVEELAAFRDRAPGVRYAHPTVEHFTPLFVTLGAATDAATPSTCTIEGYAVGLSKRSLQVA